MAEDGELVAEFVELLLSLLAEEQIELSTIRDIPLLADQLFQLTRNDPEMDLGEWLVEQDEVTELFIDSTDLADRAAPIIRRMREGDPAPQWNAALAAVIIDNPDDLAAREVFGDWLEQAGDPRGELVAIQLELARTPDPELERREASLLQRFHTFLLGPLAELPDPRVTYRYGFFDELTLDAPAIATTFAHPSARFLRSLTLTSVVDGLAGAALPATLKELKLHSPAATAELRIDAAIATLAKLEYLSMAWFETVTLDLAAVYPALRVLDLHASRLLVSDTTWAVALPALEELAINGAAVAADDVKDLFVRPPRGLRSLTLHGSTIASWLTWLVGSPLLAQLRVLDLRGNSTLVEAVPLILGNAGQFAHLELLDVRNATIGPDYDRVVAMGAFVRAEAEQPDNDEDYDGDEEDDDEEDEDDDGYDDDTFDSNPDTVPEDEPEEVDAEAEVEEVGVDSDAPIEERFEEPE